MSLQSPSNADLAKRWTRSLRHVDEEEEEEEEEDRDEKKETKTITPRSRRVRVVTAAPTVPREFQNALSERQRLLQLINSVEDQKIQEKKLKDELEMSRARSLVLTQRLNRVRKGVQEKESFISRSSDLEVLLERLSKDHQVTQEKLCQSELCVSVTKMLNVLCVLRLRNLSRGFRIWNQFATSKAMAEQNELHISSMKFINEARMEAFEASHRKELLQERENADSALFRCTLREERIVAKDKIQSQELIGKMRECLASRCFAWLKTCRYRMLVTAFHRWSLNTFRDIQDETIRELQDERNRDLELAKDRENLNISKQKSRHDFEIATSERKYAALRRDAKLLMIRGDGMSWALGLWRLDRVAEIRVRLELALRFHKWARLSQHRGHEIKIQEHVKQHKEIVRRVSVSFETKLKSSFRRESILQERANELHNHSEHMSKLHALTRVRTVLSAWRHRHLASAMRQWAFVVLHHIHSQHDREQASKHFEEMARIHDSEQRVKAKADALHEETENMRRELALRSVRTTLQKWRHQYLSAAFRKWSTETLKKRHDELTKERARIYEETVSESFQNEQRLLEKAEELHSKVEKANLKLFMRRCSVVLGTWNHRSLSRAFRQWVFVSNARTYREIEHTIRKEHENEVRKIQGNYRGALHRQREDYRSRVSEMRNEEKNLREQAAKLHEKGTLAEQKLYAERIRSVLFRLTHRRLAAAFLRWVVNTVRRQHQDGLRREDNYRMELEEDLTYMRTRPADVTDREREMLIVLRKHPIIRKWLLTGTMTVEGESSIDDLMKKLESVRVELNTATPTTQTTTTTTPTKGKIISNDRKVEPSDIPEEMIMTPTGAAIRAGDLVLVEEGVGRVRYVGECHFKPGLWMGIELNHPFGTNDGSIAGRRYFYTNPKRGTFHRPWNVRLPDGHKTYEKSYLKMDLGWQKYISSETGEVFYYISSRRRPKRSVTSSSSSVKIKSMTTKKEELFKMNTPERPWRRHRMSIVANSSMTDILKIDRSLDLSAALDMFNSADNEGTGVLNATEFVNLVSAAFDLSQDKAHRLFQCFDRNSDSGITFAEFVSFIRKSEAMLGL